MSPGAVEAARILRRLRVRRGLSWADQARALRDLARSLHVSLPASVASIQRTIARWEAARAAPGERYQLLLAYLYARTPAGVRAHGNGTDLDELLTAFRRLGIDATRVEEIRTLVATSDLRDGASLFAALAPGASGRIAAALADPRNLDAGCAAALDHAVRSVDRQVGAVPFVRLQVELAPVLEILRRLDLGELRGDVRAELHTVAAHAYMLAGRIAFETRDDAMSSVCYTAAVDHAGQLADRWHRAAVRVSHAMVTLYATGDLDRARMIADAAADDARNGSSRRMRARAYALKAETAARAGRPTDADSARRLAWYEVDADSAGDPAPNTMDAGRLRGFDGVCELHAGQADRAHDWLEASVATLTEPRERVQRGIVLSDQVLAQLRLAEPASATTLLHDCIDLTAATDGRVAHQRIRHARLELESWRTETFVADLDEHLHRSPLAL